MKRKTSPSGQRPAEKVAAETPLPPRQAPALPGAVGFLETRKEHALILTSGRKIVYPGQGPCLIGPIVKMVIAERPLMFYRLQVLNDNGGELFVPVEKIEAVGIRLLLETSEIPQLLDHLTQATTVADNHRQRSLINVKLFSSGSAFDLAEIVGSLTELNNTRSLSFGEHKTLEQAKGLLVCEIAEVTGTTREAASQQIAAALEVRTKKAQAGSVPRRRSRPSRNQAVHQAASG